MRPVIPPRITHDDQDLLRFTAIGTEVVLDRQTVAALMAELGWLAFTKRDRALWAQPQKKQRPTKLTCRDREQSLAPAERA